MLGYGTVGAGVAWIMFGQGELLSQKVGHPLRLVKAVVRDLAAKRDNPPPLGFLTDDPLEVVGNPDIQVVVEVMGGIEPARSLILRALESGQHVVTANKALLATHGRELFDTAAAHGRELNFEAAAAGAIPVIRTLKEGLAANRIRSVFGILNGTTNYILDLMTKDRTHSVPYEAHLKAAQDLGYAEADPTMDVDGTDAAQKLVLLTALAYGTLPTVDDVRPEGITRLEPLDFVFADELGYVIKLLAMANLPKEGGRLEVRLKPTMIPKEHLLAGVPGAMNAVMIRGHAAGDIFLSGAGAGMRPTASAVVGDIIDTAKVGATGHPSAQPSLGWHGIKAEGILPPGESRTRHFLRFTVRDLPGVLSAISGILGRHGISIAQVIQRGSGPEGAPVTLVMLTHTAKEKDVEEALVEASRLDALTAGTRRVTVEDFGDK
jgi:homoserine dehydrogenase